MADSVSIETIQKEYWESKKSVPEIAKSLGISAQSIYELMRKKRIPRRNYTESNYLVYKDKPGFSPKLILTPDEEILKAVGSMLYWAEGARGVKAGVMDFSNSNPDMIRVFLKFLRQICGVSELRLRAYLYHHGTKARVERSIRFWEKITGIPSRQFSKPYIRKGNPHYSGRIMPNGLLHIRYSDRRLLGLIHRWIAEYTDSFQRAGTQVANGGGL